MERLELLESMKLLLQTGKIHLGEPVQESIGQVERLIRDVEQLQRQEIFLDITAKDTSYFAPEQESWEAFLNKNSGSRDYGKVLEHYFTQECLEKLWNGSHITEEFEKWELQENLFQEIGRLKMMDLVYRQCTSPLCQEAYSAMELQAARIKGYYNLLYED